MSEERFEGWAIVELMGHRRLAGFVRDVEMFGGRRLRLDVPVTGAPVGSSSFCATQFYGSAALYCVTPTDEATARRVAALAAPAPVHTWELPQLPAKQDERPRVVPDEDELDDDGPDADDEEEFDEQRAQHHERSRPMNTRRNIAGKAHKLCVLLVTGRDERGLLWEARFVHDDETVKLAGGEEFVTVWVPAVVLDKKPS